VRNLPFSGLTPNLADAVAWEAAYRACGNVTGDMRLAEALSRAAGERLAWAIGVDGMQEGGQDPLSPDRVRDVPAYNKHFGSVCVFAQRASVAGGMAAGLSPPSRAWPILAHGAGPWVQQPFQRWGAEHRGVVRQRPAAACPRLCAGAQFRRAGGGAAGQAGGDLGHRRRRSARRSGRA
jgi:hypothetical protein